ncbi:MAG: sodium-independent anion transporter [Verrucomicrobia bacterium GWF2_51_19]|nr:MAG: sodium-independent anion transporter [Verrucomicrobia bacterium GWF2_51_19]
MYYPKLLTELKNYNKEKLFADLFAGATVGVIAMPLAIAFAIASGVSPERGLFTAIVAGFLISLLGGSKVQIGGPTGAFVVIVSGIVIQYGYSGLVVCTLMAGVLLILFGVFRFGGLIKFIPFPVTTGFTTGIAVVIFSTQIADLFGLKLGQVPAEFLEKWEMYVTHFGTLSLPTLAIGLETIAVIIFLRHYFPKVPGMLVGIIVATATARFLHLDIVTIGTRFGALPNVLPHPSLPDLSFNVHLFKPAFTIALLAAIESLLSATVADGMMGGKHRPNAELIAQGVANIACMFFGGIPATGAIARTATNVKSGARTPIAGMVHAVVLLLLLLLLAPVATLIPLSALAGVLIVVSYNMSEMSHFISILRSSASDSFVLLITFLLTVFVDLTVAVEVGIVLAAFLFVKRMAEVTNVSMITAELRADEDDTREDVNSIETRQVPAGVEVFEVNGPFFFGMIDTFKSTINGLEKPVPVLIIRIRKVLSVDATAIHALRELAHRCKKENTHLIFSGVHAQPLLAFKRSGLLDEIGRENFCKNIDIALLHAQHLLAKLHKPA